MSIQLARAMRALALTTVVALVASAMPSQAAWSSFHNDERNTGFQSGTSYQVYEDVWWSLKLKNTQIDASPVVKDGVVLIGAWDKQVRAFDAESGNIKWNATTFKGSVYGTPAIVAGRVFLVDSAGQLEARDLQKGTVLATAQVGPTRGSITIHEGKLFIGNEAGVMQAFDTETLTLLWKFTISQHGAAPDTNCPKFAGPGSQIRGAPAVYDQKVIFGSLNHYVYAVDEHGNPGQSTDLQWFFLTGDAIFASPAIDQQNKRVLVGSYDEYLYSMPVAPAGEGPIHIGGKPCTAYNATGSLAWKYHVPSDIGTSKIHSSPATDGQRIYFGANNGRVYALNLDGTKAWEFTTGGQVVSSPAVSNNIVVVGSDDAKLYWLDASNGEKKKEFLADAPIKSSPALDGDRTFIASFEGSVYMFGKKIPTRPDLRVASITYTTGALSIVVSNTGDGKAEPSKLRLTIDGSLAGDLEVPAIEPGQSVTITHSVTLTQGSHTVVATADQSGVVTEKEENDNQRTEKVAPPADAPLDDDDEGDKGGFKIPGLGVPLLVLGIALLAFARRRR